MRSIYLILVSGAGLTLCGCTGQETSGSSLARGLPALDPVAFFTGRTQSEGVIENALSGSKRKVTTGTRSRWAGRTLCLEQDLAFSDGTRQHRSWRIRKLDAHHFEATANDMVGTARGESFGNTFQWSFTLTLSPGNSLANVRMTQSMYLQRDGRSLTNYTTIRKFGIPVAHVTETFHREARN